MSILSGPEILRRLNDGVVAIDPFDDRRLGANSYDLTLGPLLRVYQAQIRYEQWRRLRCPDPPPPSYPEIPEECVLDPYRDNPTVDVPIPESGLVLMPGVLYLGATVEVAGSDFPLAPMLEGRSTWGRLGVAMHQTAGVGDCGFRRRWVLEISCLTPVRVRPGDAVCQVMFHTVEGPMASYAGRYADQDGPVAARPLVPAPPGTA